MCRRYLLEQVILAVVINAVLNGPGPWFFFRYVGLDKVPLHGPFSITGDVIGTFFLLPFFTCFALTLETSKRMRRGLHLGEETARPAGASMWTSARIALPRSLALGAAGSLLFAPILLGVLYLLGLEQMDLMAFCVVKATGTAIVAAVLAPWIALRTLADPAFT